MAVAFALFWGFYQAAGKLLPMMDRSLKEACQLLIGFGLSTELLYLSTLFLDWPCYTIFGVHVTLVLTFVGLNVVFFSFLCLVSSSFQRQSSSNGARAINHLFKRRRDCSVPKISGLFNS
jgi:hypothetical protein